MAKAVYLGKHIPGENTVPFQVCSNCYKVCKMSNIQPMNRSNGNAYPPPVSNVNVCNYHWRQHMHLLYTNIKERCLIKSHAEKAENHSKKFIFPPNRAL